MNVLWFVACRSTLHWKLCFYPNADYVIKGRIYAEKKKRTLDFLVPLKAQNDSETNGMPTTCERLFMIAKIDKTMEDEKLFIHAFVHRYTGIIDEYICFFVFPETQKVDHVRPMYKAYQGRSIYSNPPTMSMSMGCIMNDCYPFFVQPDPSRIDTCQLYVFKEHSIVLSGRLYLDGSGYFQFKSI